MTRNFHWRIAAKTCNKLRWEAINAISQFVSSIAVVLSVLYLAKEVHRSSRIAKVAVHDAAASAVRGVTNTFMENGDMLRTWGTGLENLKSLWREDQARFFHAAHQFLKALETIHFHRLSGLMDEELWRGWQELLRGYIAAPGIARYWDIRSQLFSGRFRFRQRTRAGWGPTHSWNTAGRGGCALIAEQT